MNRIIFILILFPNILLAQRSQVRLIDYSENKIPAYCGYQIEYGVLKIILLEKIQNHKDGDTIFIFQECPREVMISSVGNYINNQIYYLELGAKIDKFTLAGVKICKKYYKNDNPTIFWRGYLYNERKKTGTNPWQVVDTIP